MVLKRKRERKHRKTLSFQGLFSYEPRSYSLKQAGIQLLKRPDLVIAADLARQCSRASIVIRRPESSNRRIFSQEQPSEVLLEAFEYIKAQQG